MKLSDVIPDPEALIALEPDELGLRLLPMLGSGPSNGQVDLAGLINRVNGPPNIPSQPGLYPSQYRDQIDEALREAWAWLEGAALLVSHPNFGGLVMKLSRRARKLAQEPDPVRAHGTRRIPKDALHRRIREDVWALYHRGKYDTAVFEAMKAVEVAVRTAAGLPDTDLGVSLMRNAFHVTTGPLTDPTRDVGEREARAHLFAGAVGSYKNPHSHRNVALTDPDEAAEIIMLANHLLRIVDSRRKTRSIPVKS